MVDTDSEEPDEGSVSWRQLDRRTWVGHAGIHGVGTIEQGSRYVYVDADGAPHPGFRTLREALDSATGSIVLPQPPRPVPSNGLLSAPLLVGAITLAALVVVLAAAWWALGSTLFPQ